MNSLTDTVWHYCAPDDERYRGEEADHEIRAAVLRQFSVQRMVAYGVELGDALGLIRTVEAGVDLETAAAAADARLNDLLADNAAPPSVSTLADLSARRSALARIGQIMLTRDDNDRRRTYAAATQWYEEAASAIRLEPDVERRRIVIPTVGGPIAAWSIRPADDAPRPHVLIMAGVEGWGLDLESCAHALARRGLSALVVDGPGQGETRLAHRHFLGPQWIDSWQAVLAWAVDAAQGRPVGVWGNSMGGGMAIQLAHHYPAIAATCDNGGGIRLLQLRDRPHFFAKMAAFCDPEGEAGSIDRAWASVELDAGLADSRMPLLVVHGGLDPLISTDDAMQMTEWSRAEDRLIRIFDDGDHCIYNHESDRNNLCADWFLDRLGSAQ